jgi:hypothetical protein
MGDGASEPSVSELGRGPIFDVVANDELVTCRVWRDATIDAETGALCAAQMSALIEQHALSGPRKGFVFDVRKAPPAFGPKTEASITQLLERTIASGRKMAVLVGGAMQELQYKRLCKDVAPACSLVTPFEAAARDFVTEP